MLDILWHIQYLKITAKSTSRLLLSNFLKLPQSQYPLTSESVAKFNAVADRPMSWMKGNDVLVLIMTDMAPPAEELPSLCDANARHHHEIHAAEFCFCWKNGSKYATDCCDFGRREYHNTAQVRGDENNMYWNTNLFDYCLILRVSMCIYICWYWNCCFDSLYVLFVKF